MRPRNSIKSGKKTELLSQKGFTLIEVLISLLIFSIFISSYLVSEGYNVSDSLLLDEEIKLKGLTQEVMNELIINPPKNFRGITLGSPEFKSFEDEPQYAYKVQYKELKIPDLTSLTTSKEEEEQGRSQAQNPYQKRVLETLKKNVEEIVYQVEVTVQNKQTKFSYSASTWIIDRKANIELNL